jgi:predicted RND superfamily exporter protein
MNNRYVKQIADEMYLKRVLEDARDKVEDMQYSESYSEDGAKEVIVNWLDSLEIYPDDLDSIMAELEF